MAFAVANKKQFNEKIKKEKQVCFEFLISLLSIRSGQYLSLYVLSAPPCIQMFCDARRKWRPIIFLKPTRSIAISVLMRKLFPYMALYDSVDMQIMLSVLDFGATGPPIVVAFYSSNTSNYASSVVDDLAKSTSEYGNIKFLKVDVDEDIDLRNLASSQFISSTPAFVYLKEGKKRDLHYGADADEVKEFLDALKK
ncbi:hypothetical protein CJ030_MR4G020983 [Morella rubra]|uniref:Thioredoxin domain-containing protein n=1 Tax=Morella rubra TaxID=262757 RepID=A0A6A1W0L1_9ROSI|nr:hypothetical protein CJ030_MR4G020983 [Morella rubra]